MLEEVTSTEEEADDMAKQPDLSELNTKQLKKVIEEAQARLKEIEATELLDVRKRLNEWVAESGFPLDVILGGQKASGKAKGKDGRTPARDKYSFPDGTKWSGKGRIPLTARPHLEKDGVSFTDSGFFEDKDAGKKALERYLI